MADPTSTPSVYDLSGDAIKAFWFIGGLLAGVVVDRLVRRFVEEHPRFDIEPSGGDALGVPHLWFDVRNRGMTDWPKVELILRGRGGCVASIFPADDDPELLRGQVCRFAFKFDPAVTEFLRTTMSRDRDHELQIRVVRSERVLFRSRRIGKRLLEVLVAGPGQGGYPAVTMDDLLVNLAHRTLRGKVHRWREQRKFEHEKVDKKKGK